MRALLACHPEVWLSVSATTRAPRPGEVDGEHYYFLNFEQFDTAIAAGNMLEWATVHGQHRYGTPREPVVERLNAGIPVLLEIDLDGARQVRVAMPEARLVFIAPPSWEELERRLLGRGTEGPEERERRLATAKREMAAQDEFDVVIVNHEVEQCAAELAQVMGLER